MFSPHHPRLICRADPRLNRVACIAEREILNERKYCDL